MQAVEDEVVDNVVPFRSSEAAGEGPYAKTSLLTITDSRVSDSEHRLLCLIQVRSVRLGYTTASWSTLAADLNKSERRIQKMAKRLEELGLLKVTPSKNGDSVAKRPALTHEVYGETQEVGWQLLSSKREQLDLAILRSEHLPIPHPRVERQVLGGRNPGFQGGGTPGSRGVESEVLGGWNLGFVQRRKSKEKKKGEERRSFSFFGHPADGVDLGGSKDPEADQKKRDDNRSDIDEPLFQEHMSKEDEIIEDSGSLGTHGETNTLVPEQKKLSREEETAARDARNEQMAARLRQLRDTGKAPPKATPEERWTAERKAQGKAAYAASKAEAKAAGVRAPATVVRSLYEAAVAKHINPDLVMTKWGQKENSLAKKLLEELGPSVVEKGIERVCEKWDSYKKRFKREGIPDIGFLYNFRSDIFGEVQIQESKAKPSKTNDEPDYF
jgi:hypothetical protein